MSAIAGIITRKKIFNDDLKQIVKKMCDIQSHRGPDGEGIVLKENTCLGHRLLNLHKFSNNVSQPMSNEDNNILIICDGNIFNYQELKRDLIKKGHIFKSDTDTEVIIHLYEEYGKNCLQYLRGDFAFAIWDNNKKELFLARDRFGIKPLFYYYDGKGTFLFASEIKALIKTGLVNKEIDLEAIYHYLFFTFFPQPQTPFKFVKSLLPGHYLIYSLSNRKIQAFEYWDVPYWADKIIDEKYIVDECKKFLDESTKIRLIKNVPMGICLSGGIDSSTVAAEVAKFSEYPVKTFTFGFGKIERKNEWEFARLVAKKIGSIHLELTFNGNDILMELPKIVWHFDTPTVSALGPYFFAKAARNNQVNLAFRGDGGNSGFEYPVDLKFPTLQKIFIFFEIFPERIQKHIYKKAEECMTYLECNFKTDNHHIAGLIGLLARYFRAITGRENFDFMFSEKERKKLFIEKFWENSEFKETSEIVLECMEKIKAKDIVEKLIYEEYKRFSDQGLTHISSLSSAFSLEVRFPFYDDKLVEFLQRIPVSYRIDKAEPNIHKYILKKVVQDMLPPEIIKRKQQGFYMPINMWLRNELKPLVNNILSKESVKKRNIFNYKSIKSVYDQFYSSNNPKISWRKIWSLVVLETWFRLYYDPSDITPPTFTGKDIIG